MTLDFILQLIIQPYNRIIYTFHFVLEKCKRMYQKFSDIIFLTSQNDDIIFPPTTSKDDIKEIATGSCKPRIGWLAVKLSLNINLTR